MQKLNTICQELLKLERRNQDGMMDGQTHDQKNIIPHHFHVDGYVRNKSNQTPLYKQIDVSKAV